MFSFVFQRCVSTWMCSWRSCFGDECYDQPTIFLLTRLNHILSYSVLAIHFRLALKTLFSHGYVSEGQPKKPIMEGDKNALRFQVIKFHHCFFSAEKQHSATEQQQITSNHKRTTEHVYEHKKPQTALHFQLWLN